MKVFKTSFQMAFFMHLKITVTRLWGTFARMPVCLPACLQPPEVLSLAPRCAGSKPKQWWSVPRWPWETCLTASWGAVCAVAGTSPSPPTPAEHAASSTHGPEPGPASHRRWMYLLLVLSCWFAPHPSHGSSCGLCGSVGQRIYLPPTYTTLAAPTMWALLSTKKITRSERGTRGG